MTGEIFGRLTVLEEFMAPCGPHAMPRRHAYVSCECGRRKVVLMTNLRTGKTKGCHSCNRPSKHGESRRGNRSPTYGIWANMMRRCDSPKIKSYPYYGGRGIVVCERWHTYENFKSDMGDRPVGLSLDRIDVNGNYEPSNCRWATAKEQARNTRRNRIVEHEGKRYGSLTEFTEAMGIRNPVVRNRLFRGWSLKEAVETPLGERR